MREPTPKGLQIGQRIRDARQAKGYTLEHLGNRIGVTKGGIWSYEKGQTIPAPEHLQALAEELGLTTDWLLTGGEPEEQARAQTEDELAVLADMRSVPITQQSAIRVAVAAAVAALTKK